MCATFRWINLHGSIAFETPDGRRTERRQGGEKMIENETALMVEAEGNLVVEVIEESEYMAYFDVNGSC